MDMIPDIERYSESYSYMWVVCTEIILKGLFILIFNPSTVYDILMYVLFCMTSNIIRYYFSVENRMGFLIMRIIVDLLYMTLLLTFNCNYH